MKRLFGNNIDTMIGIATIFPELINYALTAVEFLKNNIDFFNNHPDIYGELSIELASVTQKLTSYKVS